MMGCILILMIMTVLTGTHAEHISRQNYGYTLQKKGEALITTGQVRLIFHVVLPNFDLQDSHTTFNCTQQYNDAAAQRRCVHFQKIVRAIYELKHDMTHHLRDRMAEINELLHNLPRERSRPSRSLFTWIGSGIADVFGLSTHKDMNSIQALLTRVLSNTQRATQTWRKGQNLFTNTVKLTNERFRNIEALLSGSRMSIQQENERLTNLKSEVMGNYKLMAVIVKELHIALRHVQEIEALYNGIQELSHGKLSNHLVRRSTLRRVLNTMAIQMRSYGNGEDDQYELIHDDFHYYYKEARIGAAVHNSDHGRILFIVLHAPITLHSIRQALTVWQVQVFPLISPDSNQIYYTVLNSAPKYILYHAANPLYLEATHWDDFPNQARKNFLDLHDSSLIFHKTTQKSCAMALFGTNLDAIQSACGYHMIFRPLPRQVFRITDDKLLLNNISQIVVKRKARRYVHPINTTLELNATQTFYSIPCETQVEADNKIFFSTEHCDGWFTSVNHEVTHPVNFLILRQYFGDNELLQDINSAIELNESVKSQLPLLEIEKPKFAHKLAVAEDFKFKFEDIINSSQNAEKAYESLSHLVFSKMIENASNENSFNFFSWIHWIAILSMCFTILNIVAISLLFFRYKSLSLLILSLSKARGLGFDFIVSTTTTTPAPDIWHDVQKVVKQIWSLELILLLIFLLLLSIAISYLIGKCKRRPHYATIIELHLSTKTEDILFTWLKLQYPANYYRIDLSPIAISFNKVCFFSRLYFNKALEIHFERTQKQIKIPSSLFILPHLSRKAWRMINDDSCNAMIVITTITNEIVDILPLSWHGRAISKSDTSIPLYPTHELQTMGSC